MTAIDVSALRRHVGTRIAEEDVATAAPLKAIVATFDRQEDAPAEGQPIPPGWHIGYFLSTTPTAALARDGTPSGTGVLPKVPLPRRMYAGARLAFHDAIRVGDRLRRETELTDLQLREGGTGVLILMTQTRRITTPRGLAITEDYDIVYREAANAGAKSGIPRREQAPSGLPWRRTVAAGPVALFRFSALTGNPHRIHYDRPYAMEIEGYPGLVVHGPFIQTCLIDFVRDHAPGRWLGTFRMRARAPLFDTAPLDLVGRPTQDGAACEVWALTPTGNIAVEASATFL